MADTRRAANCDPFRARGWVAAVLLLCTCELYANLRGSVLSASVSRLAATPPSSRDGGDRSGERAPRAERARGVAATGAAPEQPTLAHIAPFAGLLSIANAPLVPSPLCPQHRWARNMDHARGHVPPRTSGPDLPVFRGGDLEARCELERALAARSRHGELIFTIATEQASSYAINLIWGLRRVGIDHSIVIVLEPEHCALLASEPWRASCAHTSFRTVGLVGAVTHAYRLEWSKLHYVRRAIALGVSPLFLDADVAVSANPYPLLRSAALADKHAIFAARASTAHCGRILLGLVYCNRCAPGGPAERMFARAFARHERYAFANASTVAGWWSKGDRLGVCTGPYKHRAIHRSNELLSDLAMSACCGAQVSYAVAPASRHVPAVQRVRFSAVYALPRCAMMPPPIAPGVYAHEIRHWHEPLISAAEREAALRPLAHDTRGADGFRHAHRRAMPHAACIAPRILLARAHVALASSPLRARGVRCLGARVATRLRAPGRGAFACAAPYGAGSSRRPPAAG